MKEKMAKAKAWMKKNRDYIVAGALAIGGAVGSAIFINKINEEARETAKSLEGSKILLTNLCKIGLHALQNDKYTEEEIEEILKED